MRIGRILLCLAFILIGIAAITPLALADTPTPTPTVTPPPTSTPPPTATPVIAPAPSTTAAPVPTPIPTPAPTPTAPPEKVDIQPTYPAVQAAVGTNFAFEIKMTYTGDKAKVFDLQAKAPAGWDVYINPQYDTVTKISSIRLDPTGAGTTVNVIASAVVYPLPEPGTYTITFTATSGTVKATTNLTAIIIPKYQLSVISATDTQTVTARTGQDNFFSIKVQNLGTTPVDKIQFSAKTPDNWNVTFSPTSVDSLSYFDEKSVDVDIKPAANTTPGDYIVTVSTIGQQTQAQDFDIRVTVEGPNTWAWVGVAIIGLVVVALIAAFLRFIQRK